MSESIAATPPLQTTAAAPAESLGRQAVRNSLWTIGSYGLCNVIRLFSNLIITYLLAQELIGVSALVTTVMIGMRLFSDVGIGPAIVTNPRGVEEPFLRTAFATQILRGIAIWLAASLVAYPVAWIFANFEDPIYWSLAKLLPIAGLQAIFEGLRSTAIFRLQRTLKLQKVAMLDVLEVLATSSVMICWARLSPTIWALVFPSLIGSAITTSASHLMLRDRVDRPQWYSDCAREMMKIGRWIFLSTALTFLAQQFAPLIFGTLVAPALLATYWIANNLASTPFNAIYKLGSSVLFPTFSRVVNDPERFADVYGRARSVLLAAGGMLVCGMIAASPFAVRMLYKPEYESAALMLQLMTISIWFQITDTTNVAGLLARQHAGWMVSGNLSKVLIMFGLVPVVFHFWGFEAALLALGVADFVRACIGIRGLTTNGVPWRTLRADFLLPPLIAAVGLIALATTSHFVPSIEAHFPMTKWGRRSANLVLFSIAAAQVCIVFVPLTYVVWKRARRTSVA